MKNGTKINPRLGCFFSIYSKDPKLLWLPNPKWLKPEMTQQNTAKRWLIIAPATRV